MLKITRLLNHCYSRNILSRRLFSNNDGNMMIINPNQQQNEEESFEDSLVPVGPTIPLHSPLNIDTFHWVKTLCETKELSAGQSEALMTTAMLISSHRLLCWLPTLVTLPRLHNDVHLLRTLTQELGRLQHPEHALEATKERIAGELHGAAEEMRDGGQSARTELGITMAGYKAEGREEGQKWEMELHRLEGKLEAGMAAFRSDAENVKVKSMYSFAMVIFSMLMIVVVERTSSQKKKDDNTNNKDPSPTATATDAAADRLFL